MESAHKFPVAPEPQRTSVNQALEMVFTETWVCHSKQWAVFIQALKEQRIAHSNHILIYNFLSASV